MKRYSREVREEAAFIASVSASSTRSLGLDNALGSTSPESHRLYWSAWHRARVTHHEWWQADPLCRELDAEAEALIRTGWTP